MAGLPFHPVKLIDEVKKRPGLWSTEHPSDRDSRLALWKEVGQALFDDWDDCDKATAYDRVLQIQKRWRCLRDCYGRELKAQRSGVRPNKRVYIYFKRMAFLGGFEPSDVPEDIEDDPDTDDYEMPLPTPKKAKKHKLKREPKESEHISPGDFEISIPSELPLDEGDNDRLFLLSFLPEIKQLPLHLKMWVRAQIANIMQEAVTNFYNETNMPSSMDSLKRQRKGSSD